MRKTIFFVKSNEDVNLCPICDGLLAYRDSRTRSYLEEGRKKTTLIIRRLKCKQCATHHSELPDIISPNKHYKSTVIEDVVDDLVGSEDELAEDYPCSITRKRWMDWIRKNVTRIDGYIKSVGYRLLDFSELFLKDSTSLLNTLRINGLEWLGIVNRLIYNSGGFLPT